MYFLGGGTIPLYIQLYITLTHLYDDCPIKRKCTVDDSQFSFHFHFFFSARPVYLQERYSSNSPNHGSSTTPVRDRSENQQPQQRWSIASSNVSRQSSSMPPERPPKKPHLRGSSDSATPPITPPRGVTPSNNSSRPASRASSNATPPSRGTTPTSSIIRNNRPKYPSPPGSPEKSRLQETPLPPPPPMETNFDYDTPSEKSSIQSMPLPPPPAPVSKAEVETVVSIEDKPTLR